MTYDDIAAHFLVPGPDPIPEPAVPATAARRLRDAVEPVATIGWWSREAAAATTSLGLDFFGGYVWGRAAALGGSVAAPVVISAFGVFDTSLLTAVWGGASSTVTRDQVLAARERGAVAGLAAATDGADPATVAWFGDRLLAATADLDGMGRPLFAALRALPVPAGPTGRAWRAAELVREHRGDGHLAACVAAGLSAAEANVLTELWLGYPVGGYSASRGLGADGQQHAVDSLAARGWIDDAGLTAAGRSARDEVEATTDRSQDALIAALGDDVEAVIAAGAELSGRVLAARATPADPRKRAAG